jgi:chromosome partitioning protein
MSAKVLACSTNKGGVLKSSVTVNLAGVWASQGKKVLIIDMDNQGNSLVSFGKNPDNFEDTVYDVLMDGLAAEHTIVNVWENIDVLPSNDDMRFFENDLKESGRDQGNDKFLFLKNAVNHLRNQYDIILVDSPPTLGTTQGNILAFVDYVIIPFQPEPYSQRSLIKIVEAIREMQEDINTNIEILGVLATLVDARATVHSEIIKECRQLCLEKDWHMFDTVIPRSIRFADELRKAGLPATISFPNHYIVKRYYDLAKEIELQWQEIEETV